MAKMNWLSKLFKGGKEQPETAPEQEEQHLGKGAQKGDPVKEEPNWAALDRLPDLKDSMLQVWQKYGGRVVPAPRMSMLGEVSPETLHWGPAELEKAKEKLVSQMEQEAKKRLRAIEMVEKQAAEAEQRRQAAGKKEGEQPEPIVPSLDASCSVMVSADKMAAWAMVFPPMGKGILGAEAVGNAMKAAGVTTGLDSDAVVRVFQDKCYFRPILVAIGTPATEGINGAVEELFPREVSHEVKIDENGMADYRAMNYCMQVEKDQAICNITLPEEGKPGVRVDGKVVEPKRVTAAKIPRGANTTVTEDGLQLVATMSGHLEYVNGAFTVKPLLEIRGDVDYSTGNIDFQGDVHVFGDVRENFELKATGNITVDGLVEAAVVEAGGDLLITRGVVGDNRALLRSKGNVRVKYLENCVVYAGQGVYADCIMTSQIFSDDTVSVTTGRGSIIGGAVTAAYVIKAQMIGAQSGRRTELTLGILPYVQSEMQNALEDLEAIAKENRELDRQLNWLVGSRGQEGSDSKLAKAKMRKSVLAMKEQQIMKRQERLVDMMVDLSKCRLECDIVYPMTSITVQDVSHVISEPIHRYHVIYDVKLGELREVL